MKLTYKNRSIFWWILALIGAFASLVLLISRFTAETNDKNVGISVFASDISELAEESGLASEFWLEHFASLGIEYIIPDHELGSYAPLTPSATGGDLSQSVFIIPYIEAAISDAAPLVLIENIERSGVNVPESFDVSSHSGDMVKTLYLFDTYRNRWSDEDSGKEIEHLLFRACVERGSRLILLRPFTYANGGMVTSPDAYTDVLLGLAQRLERYNLTVGSGFSCMRATLSSPIIFAVASFLTAALWILLFIQIPFLKRFESALCILAAIGLLAAHFVLPSLCTKALPFLCAVAFPCVACLGFKALSKHDRANCIYVHYLKFLAMLLAWSLLGGLSVGALMSHRDYLMGGAIFSGVKLSQLLPLALCFFIFFPQVFISLKADHSLKRLALLAVAAIAALCACYFLLIRSGDTVLGIGGFETALRNFLEEALYARPRTKELFFAVPLTALLIFAIRHNMPVLTLLGAECAALECISVINTFCHATAPIAVSLVRGILGALGGLIPGLVIFFILELVWKKAKKA